jgi:hypothetical protein
LIEAIDPETCRVWLILREDIKRPPPVTQESILKEKMCISDMQQNFSRKAPGKKVCPSVFMQMN